MIDTSKLHELTPDEFQAAFEPFLTELERIQRIVLRLRGGAAPQDGRAAGTSGLPPAPPARIETRGRKSKPSASVHHDLSTRSGQFAASQSSQDMGFDDQSFETLETDVIQPDNNTAAES